MEKETKLALEHSKKLRHLKQTVRFIRRQNRMNMTITFSKECSICGTQFDPEEYEECPHCVDNEFDPYSIFQDFDKDYA